MKLPWFEVGFSKWVKVVVQPCKWLVIAAMPNQDSSLFVHPVTAGKTRYIKKGPNPPACCQFQLEMVHNWTRWGWSSKRPHNLLLQEIISRKVRLLWMALLEQYCCAQPRYTRLLDHHRTPYKDHADSEPHPGTGGSSWIEMMSVCCLYLQINAAFSQWSIVQHQLWFHTLLKSCKNAWKDPKSPSSSQASLETYYHKSRGLRTS